jgi:hypothetical protein
MLTRVIAFVVLMTACGRPGALQPFALANTGMTEVVVSRTEVRVTFPRERLEKLAFSDSEAKRAYVWAIYIPETVGRASIMGRVAPGHTSGGEPRPVPRFPTLDSLARSGFAHICTGDLGHYGGRCDYPVEVSLSASRNRMILVLRDGSQIARLFALRPARVRLWSWPLGSAVASSDSVPVRYVDPQIPLPDSAMFARRRFELDSLQLWSRSLTRSIAFAHGDRSYDPPGWIQVGDSIYIGIREGFRQGYPGMSGWGTAGPHRGTWMIADTAIVRAGVPPLPRLAPGVRYHSVVGRSVGRTAITAHDIAPFQGPRLPLDPPSSVVGEVVVIPRLRSIRLFTSSDTIVENTPLGVRVEAMTPAGEIVPGVPVTVQSAATVMTTADTGVFNGLRVGVHVLTARFASLVDTVRVVVRPK